MENFIKIKHDINGNPRHVTSWLGYGFTSYDHALISARKLGGRKYNTKSFGGGIVFQAYACELQDITSRLEALAIASNETKEG